MKLTTGALLAVGLGVSWPMLPAGKPYTVSCQSGTVAGQVHSGAEAQALFESECRRPAALPNLSSKAVREEMGE